MYCYFFQEEFKICYKLSLINTINVLKIVSVCVSEPLV
jgi:hypothetical protein